MTWSKIDTPLFSPILFHPVLFAKQNAKPRVYLAPGCQVVMRKLSGYGNLQLPTPGSQRWITSTHNVANKTKNKSIRKCSIQRKTMMKTSSLWKIHPIKVREKNVCFFLSSLQLLVFILTVSESRVGLHFTGSNTTPESCEPQAYQS